MSRKVSFGVLLVIITNAAQAGSSCQRIGSQVYCDNGLTSQKIGNSTYFSNGVTWQQLGNQRFCN